jgi:hypothetical protein
MASILINISSKYEIYPLKHTMNKQCENLEYTIKNKPIYNEILNQTLNNFILKEKIDK